MGSFGNRCSQRKVAFPQSASATNFTNGAKTVSVELLLLLLRMGVVLLLLLLLLLLLKRMGSITWWKTSAHQPVGCTFQS